MKETAEKHIEKNINASETQELLIKILDNYLKKSEVVSKEPFIIEGELNRVPITCLIKNGGWIFPDIELFLFLKSSQEQKRFPIIIAKKISGILFPVFKGLSIMGLNTYKILLPEKSREIIEAVKSDEELLRELKYNNQFQFIDKEFVNEIIDERYEGEPLKNFFEVILKNHIDTYYRNFAQSKIKIADNFMGTVSQFRKNKATRGLIAGYENKQNLLNSFMP